MPRIRLSVWLPVSLAAIFLTGILPYPLRSWVAYLFIFAVFFWTLKDQKQQIERQERRKREAALHSLLNEYSHLTENSCEDVITGGYGSHRWILYVDALRSLEIRDFPDVMAKLEETNHFYEEKYNVDVIFDPPGGENSRIRKKGEPGSRGYDWSQPRTDPNPA